MRTPAAIMVHHSFTEDSKTVSWGAIERFHTSWRRGGDIITAEQAAALKAKNIVVEPPWVDVGYHSGVELTTEGFYALYGRPIHMQAAACPQGGMNQIALHVCCVGNFDLAPPSEELLAVLRKRVIRPWMIEFSIPADRVFGHREFNPAKSCPGKAFDMNELRASLK
jgi:hypothetical protein